jgi:hypothetical protein
MHSYSLFTSRVTTSLNAALECCIKYEWEMSAENRVWYLSLVCIEPGAGADGWVGYIASAYVQVQL